MGRKKGAKKTYRKLKFMVNYRLGGMESHFVQAIFIKNNVNMYNKSYYPTPKELIEKMVAPYKENLQKLNILEPSAGMGAILEYLQWNGATKTKLFACEIDEHMKATVVGKGFKVIMAQFMDNQFGKSKPTSLGAPSGALTTNPKCNLVSVGFGIRSNGGHPKDRVFSLCNPMNTLTTSPNQQLVSAAFLMPTNFNNDPTSLDDPSPVITANRKWHYLVNPAFGWPAHSIKKPCFTLVAKMDKAPPYLMTVEENENTTFTATPRPEYYADTTICPELRILAFMKDYGIEDIFMRMLEIEELKRIQGFPECYILLGTKNNQKKFIGNAVVPQVVSAWACAYYMEINEAKTIQLQMF